MSKQTERPMDRAIAELGGGSELARKLGINRAAVSMWRAAGFIPAARAIQIEQLTGGKFKAADLVAKQ